MKGNYKLGTALAIIGILTTVLLIILLASIYMPTVEGKIIDERPDEAITVRIVFALLGWVGMTAGALWVVVLYGFLNKKEWAWGLGTVAAMVHIVAGFFPMIPPASIGMPYPTLWVQMVNWWGAAAWVVFIFALVKGKSWTIPAGIFAASMSIFGGIPVGLTDVVRLGRFSMFLPAPIISAVLLVVLLLPGTKKLIENQIETSTG
jgi:hypothetical protein